LGVYESNVNSFLHRADRVSGSGTTWSIGKSRSPPDRRAQSYNLGVENSGEENAVVSIHRVLSSAKIAGAINAVSGLLMGAMFWLTMILAARGAGSLRSHLAIVGASALPVFSPDVSSGPSIGPGALGAWICDVAAKKFGGIEFEIVESSSRSGIQSSVHSLHWIGDPFDITPSFS
jgi:hypothetical protein